MKATSAEKLVKEIVSTATRLLQSSGEFVKDFTPPDYLIDGLLQRRYLYSLTGMTGAGKTCVAMLLAMHVANGAPLDGREIEKARVLFFAGENPDDVRMRWIKLCEEWGCDPDNVNVLFLPGTPDITNEQIRKRIDAEVEKHGPIGLLIVDTSAAYFRGDDENSNTQLGSHARMLRSFINLPGGPTILVTAHPLKAPNMENLVPRGGGAFLNEVDGNLVVIKQDAVVQLHWHGKFRGPDFAPIPFKLTPGTTEKLKDKKGRPIWTITAAPISDMDQTRLEDVGRANQNELLLILQKQSNLSLAHMAETAEWYYRDGKPNKSLVNRVLKTLEKEKLIHKSRGYYFLTKTGEAEVKTVEAAAAKRPTTGTRKKIR